MIVIGCDLGNKTRTALTVMSDKLEVLDYISIKYDSKYTAYDHRVKVVDKINEYIKKYNVEILGFEQINLYAGHQVSKLDNILSLCRLQTTICDNLSDKIGIYHIFVQSWKSKILGAKKAIKDDAINYVSNNYSNVNLKEEIYHSRKKETETIYDSDLADSVCIAEFIVKSPEYFTNDKKLNWK